MPIPKMLQNAGENGRACSLVDFIVSHPQEFRVGAKDEVFLANAPHIYAQNVPPNIMSARILSSILASKVGVR